MRPDLPVITLDEIVHRLFDAPKGVVRYDTISNLAVALFAIVIRRSGADADQALDEFADRVRDELERVQEKP